MMHSQSEIQFRQKGLRGLLYRRFTHRLVASAQGRRHILNQMAFAEDSDEGAIFDILLERIDDPELHKWVQLHQADERRHAEMFLTALERNGFEAFPVPPELSLLDRLDKALGGFFDTFTQRENPVMEAYLLLQVIEERATTQFTELAPAFERYDPKTAEILVQIAKDEQRHLKYCVAIARRYAPVPEVATATLNQFRDVEAQVFGELSIANIEHALSNELPDMSPLEMRLWKGMLSILKRVNQPLRTPFANHKPVVA